MAKKPAATPEVVSLQQAIAEAISTLATLAGNHVDEAGRITARRDLADTSVVLNAAAMAILARAQVMPSADEERKRLIGILDVLHALQRSGEPFDTVVKAAKKIRRGLADDGRGPYTIEARSHADLFKRWRSIVDSELAKPERERDPARLVSAWDAMTMLYDKKWRRGVLETDEAVERVGKALPTTRSGDDQIAIELLQAMGIKRVANLLAAQDMKASRTSRGR